MSGTDGPWNRRDVTRRAILAAAAAAPTGWLLGCADDRMAESATTATSPATKAPGTTVPLDPTRPWWLQGNFAPVTDELTTTDLVVRGSLPPELTGLFVRNGSNPQRADSPHWFFGDGMVHGVRLERGKAQWYRNRYVRTDPYTKAESFGTGAPGGANNQSNVSVIGHANRLLTSGEVGSPFEIDPADLSTRGVVDFGGELTSAFTAHPKIDPATGRMHSFGYGFVEPYLTYHITEADGTMSHVETITLPRPTMMHDFAITESDAVFWDLPVVFHLDRAVEMITNPSAHVMPFLWEPEAGARIGVMPLAGGADAIRWFDIDPCYVFHGVNAFRDGDKVILDVCRLESIFVGGSTDLNNTGASLRRWTVDTATGTVTDDVLETANPGDLPSRDPRRVGRRHRHGYLVGARPAVGTVDLGGVIKHDFEQNRREEWDPGPTRHAGEPLFVVGDPSDDADDAGWLMTFVHDEAADESVLAVFDATAVTNGPVAEVVMPRRVPYGFHAAWVPDEAAGT